MKIFTIAHVTDGLENAWLQHLRDFDTAHPGCHFQVFADAPDVSTEAMVEMLLVNPDLTFTKVFKR
jgi:hypothetical protein